MSINGKFYFRPKQGEFLYTEYKPSMKKDCGIVGVVRISDKEFVENAMVLLFTLDDEYNSPKFVAQTRTDRDGHFFFGGLSEENLYMTKVFKEESSTRYLEINWE